MMESPAVAVPLARSQRGPVIIARIITGSHSICHEDSLIGGPAHYAAGGLFSLRVFQKPLQLQGCNCSSCSNRVIEPRREEKRRAERRRETGGFCLCSGSSGGGELSRTKNKLTSEACFCFFRLFSFFFLFAFPLLPSHKAALPFLKRNQNSETKGLG